MTGIYSYVVRYDSGFAPNPFYGYCTLATCKPNIRRTAVIGDWVVGSASNERRIRRGGHLVYVMRVTETATFDEYNSDPRFAMKRPFRNGSRKQSCGDNIYFHAVAGGPWSQRDSFHSSENGTINNAHVQRDTGVNRVLISDNYIYFGGEGPKIPSTLHDAHDRPLCKEGIGVSRFEDPELLNKLIEWVQSLGVSGYQGPPYEWLTLRGQTHGRK